MDWVIVLLLAAIVLAGGCIGVLADNLGRKIGKQRRTLLHLRPKHVARLATFLAGMLASLVTIALVFFTSSDIREWIVKGRAALSEAKQLTQDNEKLKGEIAMQKSELATLQSNAHIAKHDLAANQLKLQLVQGQLAAANSKVAVDKSALESSRRLIAQNKSDLNARKAQLKVVTDQYTAANQKYQELKNSYTALDAERKQAEDQVLSLRRDKNSLTADVEEMKTKATTMVASNRKMELQLEQDQRALDVTRSTLADVNNQLDAAKRSLASITQEKDLYKALAEPSRINKMTYASGAEVARIAVDAGLTSEQADAAVQRLLVSASEAAAALGAKAPEGAGLTAEMIPMRDSDGNKVYPEEQRQAIVRGLTEQPQAAVIIAYAEVNSFEGEPVPVQVKGYLNKVVYAKNQVLDSIEIGRKWSREKILDALDGFRTEVRKRVANDGIIPVKGHEDDILNVPQEAFFDLIDRITNAPRAVHVDVVARAQTRSADVLQADFKIR
jgi:uncharacterized protein (DUF3084 family)